MRVTRALAALAVLLALSVCAAPAFAHPLHPAVGEQVGGASAGDSAHETTGGRRAGPSPLALIAGALGLIAALPQRRRIVALALVLLVAMTALEGVTHAALHLGHLPHAKAVAVGPSHGVPVGTAIAADHAEIPALPFAGVVSEHPDRPAPGAALAPGRGRAPPPSSLA